MTLKIYPPQKNGGLGTYRHQKIGAKNMVMRLFGRRKKRC